MNPERKTKKQLIDELGLLRKRVSALEANEKKWAQSRREIYKSNARLNAILKAFDGLIYVCSRQFRIEFMNNKLIERSGYDATGELCYKVLHGRDSVCPWCVNERVFNGETVRWEIRSPKDGKWYYIVNTPLRYEDGSVSKQSMIVDITERKLAEEALRQAHADLELTVANRTAELASKNSLLIQAVEDHQLTEKALRESEEKYRGLVDNIGIGIALISPGMEILTMNEQMKQWFPEIDISKKPICYKTFNTPPRESVCDYCPTCMTLQDGQVHQSVTETPQENTIRHYKVISSPIKDSGGNITAAIEMVEDITAHLKMQERLRDSELRYRTIFETTGNATMIVEADSSISLVNTEFEKLSGYTKEEIEGIMSWEAFISEGDLAMMQKYHQLRRKDPEAAPRHYECRVKNRMGRIRDVLTTVAILPGTFRSVVSLMDITESKKAQLALEASEKQLREFSSRLQSAQEEERKRIARDLHDSIGQSLMVIKLNVEKTIKSIPAGDDNEETIASPLQSLIPLIQSCVEETRRICSGLRPHVLDDIGVIAAIGWFCRNFHISFPNLLIKRTIDVAEDQIPEHLKIVIFRILQEALNNITKYSRATLADIRLGQNEGRLELNIRDNGAGFDLDTVLNGDNRNRGLGLSGMRERTELSGGRFKIESTKGKGTSIFASWIGDER
ncbi:MAG: PAS domain S-box protein [Desulfobacteraceae bacterium]